VQREIGARGGNFAVYEDSAGPASTGGNVNPKFVRNVGLTVGVFSTLIRMISARLGMNASVQE
jgi:hypothetical protein